MKGQATGKRVETLGHRVRWARQHNTKLDKSDVARQIGVNQFRITAIERGVETSLPRPLLVSLAKVLKTSPDWLKFGTDRDRFFQIRDFPSADLLLKTKANKPVPDPHPHEVAPIANSINTRHPQVSIPSAPVASTPISPEPEAPVVAPAPPPDPETLAGVIWCARHKFAQPLTLSMVANASAIPLKSLERLEAGEEFTVPNFSALARALKLDARLLLEKALPGRVRARRLALKMDVPELAAEIGQRARAIEAVEMGLSQNPVYLPALARVLGVSEHWLRTGKENAVVETTAAQPEASPPISSVEPPPSSSSSPPPAPENKSSAMPWPLAQLKELRKARGWSQSQMFDEVAKVYPLPSISSRTAKFAFIKSVEDGRADPCDVQAVAYVLGLTTDIPSSALPTMPATPQIIGARIRDRRRELEISPVDFANHLGISAWWISQLERGEPSVRNSGPLRYEEIAKFLKMPLSALTAPAVVVDAAVEETRAEPEVVGSPTVTTPMKKTDRRQIRRERIPVEDYAVHPEEEDPSLMGQQLVPVKSVTVADEPYIPWAQQKDELRRRFMARDPLQDIAEDLNRDITAVALQLKDMGLASRPYPGDRNAMRGIQRHVEPVTDFDLEVVDGEFLLVFRQSHHLVESGKMTGEKVLKTFAAISIPPGLAKTLAAMLNQGIETYEDAIGPITAKRQIVLAQ